MSEQVNLDDLWAEAITKYEARTERRIERDKLFSSTHSFEDLEGAIQKDQDRFDSFRNNHRKVYSSLAKWYKPMEPLLKIVQKGIGNTPYAPASVVFGATAHLLQACELVSKAFDSVEELFETMTDITIRLKEYQVSGMEEPLKRKMVGILAYFLDIIGQAESIIKGKRFKQWMKSAFLKDDGIRTSMDKLHRYIDSEQHLVATLTLGTVKGLQASALEDRSMLKTGLDDIRSTQQKERERTIGEADEKAFSEALKTQAIDEVAREHAANVEKLTENTGRWVVSQEAFRVWERGDVPLLWVFGKPGVGKTMLAAQTIETLRHSLSQRSDSSSSTSLSHIYFSHENPVLRDLRQLLMAAALQAAKTNDRFKKHIIQVIAKKDDSFVSAKTIWQRLFLDFFSDDGMGQKSKNHVYVIVDGLDEAPEAERASFHACLAEIGSRNRTDRFCTVHVAVFARRDVRADADFEQTMRQTQQKTIEITPEMNGPDIEAFIKQRLKGVMVLRTLQRESSKEEFQSLAKHIYKSIQSRSSGMFLWASLAFDQIRNSPSPEAIKEALQSAPEGLDDMLYHVFKRLEVEDKMHRSYLRDLLSWVYCALRPFSISEIFVLLIISSKQHCYLVKEHLEKRYSSLFDLTRNEDLGEDDVDAEALFQETPDTEANLDFLDDSDEGSDEDVSIDSMVNAIGESNGSYVSRREHLATNRTASHDAFAMPNTWKATTVTFSHARIRDFLCMEGHPETRKHDCSVLPENMSKTQLSTVFACFQILDSNLVDEHCTPTLKTYARVNWVKHLAAIELDLVNPQELHNMARELASLFYDGERLYQSSEDVKIDFLDVWFTNDTYAKVVRSIIISHLDELDTYLKDWVSSLQSSPETLLQPLAATCARRWLTKTGVDDVSYTKTFIADKLIHPIQILRAHRNLIANMPQDPQWVLPGNVIEDLATLQDLPKTTHWHAAIGLVLLLFDSTEIIDKAIAHFTQSLELEPLNWVAMQGLAKCYGNEYTMHAEGITWMNNAVLHLPKRDEFSGLEIDLQSSIPYWKLWMGDTEGCLQTSSTIYKNARTMIYGHSTHQDKGILDTIAIYLEVLFQMGRYDDVIELFSELDRTETSEKNTSLWVIFLRLRGGCTDLFDKFGSLAREGGSPTLISFISSSLNRAVKLDATTIKDSDMTELASASVDWLYAYMPQPEDSMMLREKLIAQIDQSSGQNQQSASSVRTRAVVRLATSFYVAAKHAIKVNQSPTGYITRLRELAKRTQANRSATSAASYTGDVLALWLREHENVGENVWRSLIRPSIRRTLSLLSDADPFNDQLAYTELGQSLFIAGDIHNASIATGISMRPLEDERVAREQARNKTDAQKDNKKLEALADTSNAEQSPTEPTKTLATLDISNEASTGSENQTTNADDKEPHDSTEAHVGSTPDAGEKLESVEPADSKDESHEEINSKYADFWQLWICDGPCDKSTVVYDEFHLCRSCYAAAFCQDCIKLIENDTMPYRTCTKDHEIVRMLPITEDARKMTDALIEKRFEVQQEWLDGLRKEWKL